MVNDNRETNETNTATRLKSGTVINVSQQTGDTVGRLIETEVWTMTTLTAFSAAIVERFARSRSAIRRAALSVGLALAIAPLPGVGHDAAHAASVDTPVCQAHLEKVEMTLTNAQARLEAAAATGLQAECAAMHGQVRAMLEVRNIYRRCITGTERDDTVSMVEASIDQTAERITARCTPRSADARAN